MIGNRKKLEQLLSYGEGFNLEFKTSLSRDFGKELCAFANGLGKKSIPRNSLLFGIMHRMEMVEMIGSGIKRIRDLAKEYKTSMPKFDADENWFTVTFPRIVKLQQKKNVHKGKMSGKMSERIIELISANPNIAIPHLATLLNVVERTIERYIKILKDDKKVKRIGSAKGGHWEVIINQDKSNK